MVESDEIGMGLTKQELDVLDISVEFYESYRKLPVQHPNDTEEFIDALHRLQDLILARSGRREMHTLDRYQDS